MIAVQQSIPVFKYLLFVREFTILSGKISLKELETTDKLVDITTQRLKDISEYTYSFKCTQVPQSSTQTMSMSCRLSMSM